MVKYATVGIEETGLGLSDFGVLEFLLHKGPMPVNALGPMVDLTLGSISIAVDRLFAKGLVSGVESAEDRRIRIVDITPRGKDPIAPAFRQHSGQIKKVFSELSLEELRNLEAVATLRMMWNSARAWGYVAHDPFNGLVLPKPGLVHAVTFSLEETKRIIGSASEAHRTFYSILAETGIRGGEICALRVADLDLEDAVIQVRQNVWRGKIQTVKSRKGNRRFPISSELVKHLRGYLQNWRPNSLGLRSIGSRLSEMTFRVAKADKAETSHDKPVWRRRHCVSPSL